MNYDVNKNGYWFSKEQLEEHDRKIRAEVIDKYFELIKKHEDIYTGTVLVSQCESIAELLTEQK